MVFSVHIYALVPVVLNGYIRLNSLRTTENSGIIAQETGAHKSGQLYEEYGTRSLRWLSAKDKLISGALQGLVTGSSLQGGWTDTS